MFLLRITISQTEIQLQFKRYKIQETQDQEIRLRFRSDQNSHKNKCTHMQCRRGFLLARYHENAGKYQKFKDIKKSKNNFYASLNGRKKVDLFSNL